MATVLEINPHQRRIWAIFTSRWFALFTLICALTSGFAWYLAPGSGFWPLGIGLTPILLRIATRGKLLLHPLLDSAALIFLAAAGLSVWAAYDPAGAWAKFWILVGGVLLYFALSDQPEENLGVSIALLGLWGVVLTVYFALTNNWQDQPAGWDAINRAGAVWTQIRPVIARPEIPDDIAGGAVAFLIPPMAALALYGFRSGRRLEILSATVLTLVSIAGVVLTSSRAALLALLFGCGMCVLAAILFRPSLSKRSKRTARNLLAGIVLAAAAVLVLAVSGGSRFFPSLAGLPGGQSLIERLDLFNGASKLAGDYWLLGGGLASFGGLYSQYVLSIQVFFLGYSHNLYLDLLIEQGILGLLAVLVLLLGSLWMLLSMLSADSPEHRSRRLLWLGLFSGLAVSLVNGLIEDPLYGLHGTPLMFALPGLALSARKAWAGDEPKETRRNNRWTKPAVGFASLAVVALLLVVFSKPVLSALQANLGAVRMAKIELHGWPDQRIEGSQYFDENGQAVQNFRRALQMDPNNRAANFRLGLMALQRRNFAASIPFLEAAYRADPEHHGIRKNLGYSYTWTGQMEAAREALSGVAEAAYELGVYSWWWGTQNRIDLSNYSAEMAKMLEMQNQP